MLDILAKKQTISTYKFNKHQDKAMALLRPIEPEYKHSGKKRSY